MQPSRIDRLIHPDRPVLGRALTLIAPPLIGLAGTAELLVPGGVSLWSVSLPVAALVAWYVSLRRAAVVAVFGVILWMAAAALFRPALLGDPLWHLDTVLRLGIILLAALLAAGWRRTVVRQQEVARTDPVTGLLTAREFFRSVEAELERAARYERPFTVIHLSLDGLPAAARRGGGGRNLLRDFGDLVVETLRGPDTVAWLRGVELGLLLPETGPAAAEGAIERLQATLERELAARELPVRVSIGAVTWVGSEMTVDQLLQRAYQVLYAARSGASAGCRHEVLETAEVII